MTFISSKSQTWAPSGASWHFSYNQMMSYGFIKIDYVGDTTIQSVNCKVLLKTQYGYGFPGNYDTTVIGKEYTYFDNNVVYYFKLNQFDTLYNFNAQPGDMWSVKTSYPVDDSSQVIVDSIGYEVINSDTLKSIFVSPVAGSCVGWYNGTKILEQIGCINGYMFPEFINCIMDAGEGGSLRCYTDDAFPLISFDSLHACDFITNISVKYISEESINIYPIPASTKLTIKNKNTLFPIVKIVLMTTQGQKVFENQTQLQQTTEIDISYLPKGIYFLQITNSEDFSLIRKMIKE